MILNQAPHQVDSVRWLGGGLVRSVRAMTGVWDPARPVEGAYTAFLQFEDCSAATLVYNGYGRFLTGEWHSWVGEGGLPTDPARSRRARAEVDGLSRDDEAALKAATGYGGSRQWRTQLDPGESDRHHPHFGNTIVSCERGDLRLSVDGVLIYDDSGVREIPVPLTPAAKSKTIDELYDAVVHGRPVLHDARWGKATLEVCLAMHRSARAQAEVALACQVPTPDG